MAEADADRMMNKKQPKLGFLSLNEIKNFGTEELKRITHDTGLIQTLDKHLQANKDDQE